MSVMDEIKHDYGIHIWSKKRSNFLKDIQTFTICVPQIQWRYDINRQKDIPEGLKKSGCVKIRIHLLLGTD